MLSLFDNLQPRCRHLMRPQESSPSLVFGLKDVEEYGFGNIWYHHLLPHSTNPQGSLKVIIFSWHWRIEHNHRLRVEIRRLVRPQLHRFLAEWQIEGHSDHNDSHRTTCFADPELKRRIPVAAASLPCRFSISVPDLVACVAMF